MDQLWASSNILRNVGDEYLNDFTLMLESCVANIRAFDYAHDSLKQNDDFCFSIARTCDDGLRCLSNRAHRLESISYFPRQLSSFLYGRCISDKAELVVAIKAIFNPDSDISLQYFSNEIIPKIEPALFHDLDIQDLLQMNKANRLEDLQQRCDEIINEILQDESINQALTCPSGKPA